MKRRKEEGGGRREEEEGGGRREEGGRKEEGDSHVYKQDRFLLALHGTPSASSSFSSLPPLPFPFL
jgi:hypothetical protein